jgi:hypothetical protein
MRDQDPAGLARALIEAGRAARRTS